MVTARPLCQTVRTHELRSPGTHRQRRQLAALPRPLARSGHGARAVACQRRLANTRDRIVAGDHARQRRSSQHTAARCPAARGGKGRATARRWPEKRALPNQPAPCMLLSLCRGRHGLLAQSRPSERAAKDLAPSRSLIAFSHHLSPEAPRRLPPVFSGARQPCRISGVRAGYSPESRPSTAVSPESTASSPSTR